ncbi:hypothetical protein AVEN_25804-1 [Araneus ventricosus]|uniref:Uncharacterized protein n=1 Tax=Araneus ventricosus TaxID=182803 RepID=A0A4Y2LIK9_ARAVE|nr:hypothetical protein AVEN_25804-1 [Araneus ventricosus]
MPKFYFAIYLESGGWWGQGIIDGISRGHKLLYEIKIVEIAPVVGSGELSEGFFPMENVEWRYSFSISLENGAWCWEETLGDISRRHKLSYEIKVIEIAPVVGAGVPTPGFANYFQ